MKFFVCGNNLLNQRNAGVIIYHEGVVDTCRMRSSTMGVFFASDQNYFVQHPYINFTKDIKRYILNSTAHVWNPANDFKLFEPEGWDKIYCLKSDLDQFDIWDECDWELDEKYGVTSTDGLGFAGKRLGYDAIVIKNVRYPHGTFDEYVVYNPAVIEPI